VSRLTVSDVRAGDPGSIRAAAIQWAALAADLDAAYEQFVVGQQLVERAGQGAAVPAAAARMRGHGRELNGLVQPARRIAQVLLAHADELAALRYHLESVLASAPSGSAGQLGEILSRADRLDATTTSSIRSTVPATGMGFGRGPAWRPGRATVQRQVGRASGEVFTWWQSLTPEQQEWLLIDHPDVIGGLDGIPAVDRDRANRRHLDQLTAQAAPPPGLVAVRNRLAATDDAYLLLVDGAGDGRVVIALGNPDHARHTAVFVPGVGTDLQDIDGELARAAQLRQTADATTADARDVSVVYWLGYDPPDSLLDGWVEGPSQRGSAALAPFVDGLRVTHASASGFHVTAVGHSYGSTVVAEAAMGRWLTVDDIVVLGSPGLHTDDASDLNLDPRHVWVGLADTDEIRFAPAPIHGPEPTDPSYGANRIITDTSGHSGYWRPGSESLLNQAHIVTGQYHRVTLGHGSGPG
jgi:hypothetical protein